MSIEGDTLTGAETSAGAENGFDALGLSGGGADAGADSGIDNSGVGGSENGGVSGETSAAGAESYLSGLESVFDKDMNLRSGWNQNLAKLLPADDRRAEIIGSPENKVLENIKNLPDLARMVVESQRQLGYDKLPVPGKDSPVEDWDRAFKALGKPETADKYEIKFGDEALVPSEVQTDYKTRFHQMNLTNDQAQGFVDMHNEVIRKTIEEETAELEKKALAEATETRLALNKEWGAKGLEKAHKIASYLEKKGVMEKFRDAGLLRDLSTMRMLAETVTSMSEDSDIVSFNQNMTIPDINAQLKAMRENPKSDYNRGDQTARETYENLFRLRAKLEGKS